MFGISRFSDFQGLVQTGLLIRFSDLFFNPVQIGLLNRFSDFLVFRLQRFIQQVFRCLVFSLQRFIQQVIRFFNVQFRQVYLADFQIFSVQSRQVYLAGFQIFYCSVQTGLFSRFLDFLGFGLNRFYCSSSPINHFFPHLSSLSLHHFQTLTCFRVQMKYINQITSVTLTALGQLNISSSDSSSHLIYLDECKCSYCDPSPASFVLYPDYFMSVHKIFHFLTRLLTWKPAAALTEPILCVWK